MPGRPHRHRTGYAETGLDDQRGTAASKWRTGQSADGSIRRQQHPPRRRQASEPQQPWTGRAVEPGGANQWSQRAGIVRRPPPSPAPTRTDVIGHRRREAVCAAGHAAAPAPGRRARTPAVLGLRVLRHGRIDDLTASVGEPDQAAAPVGRIGDSGDEALAFQPVDAAVIPPEVIIRCRASSSGSARRARRPAARRRAGRSRRR